MCSHIAAFTTLYSLKIDFALLTLGFHTGNSSGKLCKIVDENIEKLEGFTVHQLPDLTGSFAAPFVVLIILFIFDWRLALHHLRQLFFHIVYKCLYITAKIQENF